MIGAIAFLVFLPEGIFFVRNPDAFFTRARAVSALLDAPVSTSDSLRLFLTSALRSLGMFSVAGDENWA
jgi:hypothetical protein